MDNEDTPLLLKSQPIYRPDHDYILIITNPFPNEEAKYYPQFKYKYIDLPAARTIYSRIFQLDIKDQQS